MSGWSEVEDFSRVMFLRLWAFFVPACDSWLQVVTLFRLTSCCCFFIVRSFIFTSCDGDAAAVCVKLVGGTAGQIPHSLCTISVEEKRRGRSLLELMTMMRAASREGEEEDAGPKPGAMVRSLNCCSSKDQVELFSPFVVLHFTH
jgi:hypothetical protein